MFRSIAFRLAAPILMAVTALLLPAFAQSQDTQSPSVAEAARRAREQKKKSEKTEKPGKVITEDTLKPASGDPQTAALPGQPKPAESSTASAEESGNRSAPGAAGSQGAAKASAAPAEKPDGEKTKAEEAALKQQLAQAEKSLDLLKRELALDQDTYYSNADYVHDTAGKAKLDSLKQQIAGKQQDIERLKTRLAAVRELLGLPAKDSSAPPQP